MNCSPPLQQPRAEWNRVIRNAQGHLPLFIMEPRHQTLRHQRANLLAGEIDNRHDQLADKFLWPVKRRDLCAGLLDADFLTEIHVQDIGRFSRFREHRRAYDPANAQVNFQKIVEANGFHKRLS